MQTNSDASSQTPQNLSCDVTQITLRIQGLGPVPSFKNKKMLFLALSKQTWIGLQRADYYQARKTLARCIMMITNPKKHEWMEQAIRSIVSQLRGLFQISEDATPGECPKLSLMYASLPLDDSLDWMIPGAQSVQRVAKGEEGCIITIEKIS